MAQPSELVNRKPNYTPYPGEGDGHPAAGYVRLHNDSGVTRDDLSVLEQLLRETDPHNPFYLILLGCEQSLPKYDHDELWLYNFWHNTPDEPRDHSTFRFFADVDGKKPWNSAVYHVFKNGEVEGWAYDPPN